MRRRARKAPPTTWRKRVAGIATGFLFIAISGWLVQNHVFLGIELRYQQPVFAVSGIAIGLIVISASLAPAQLIIKMSAIPKYRRYADVRRLTNPPKPK